MAPPIQNQSVQNPSLACHASVERTLSDAGIQGLPCNVPQDVLKTLSFGVLHFGVGFSIAWLLTGSLAIATEVALLEPAINTAAFYVHEKIWARAGRRGPAEAA